MKFYLALLSSIISLTTFAQLEKVTNPPKNWQLLDNKVDGVHGISVEKAYNTILKGKVPKKKVIVAIIDVGMDIKHQAFKGLIWTNKKEIPGNGIDDDGNGYIDDIHGWNFIGDCKAETSDCVREYVKYKNVYENSTDTLNPQVKYWKQMKKEMEANLAFTTGVFKRTEPAIASLKLLVTYWQKALHKDSIYFKEVVHLKVLTGTDSNVLKAQTKVLPLVLLRDTITRNKLTLQAVIAGYQSVVNKYKGEYETAKTIIDKNDVNYFRKPSPGDDPFTNTNILYGNADITPNIPHGNGVAGIIAALRTNSDVKGITNWVKIMSIVIVTPKVIGEERDKDVANAIKYAVDNGAKVINFSLGKKTSPQKDWVDNAVKYAAKKGVLLFAAAGNEASDNDEVIDYVSSGFADGTTATNLFKVGASTYGPSLIWKYSNYGKKEVDFFAPGDAIYSPALGDTYNRDSGTSYAAPTAAGLAALIWSYYPHLTYKQVKQCIEQSVTPLDSIVTKPGSNEKVPFKTLSRLGGVINAYDALIIADKMKITKFSIGQDL